MARDTVGKLQRVIVEIAHEKDLLSDKPGDKEVNKENCSGGYTVRYLARVFSSGRGKDRIVLRVKICKFGWS